MAEQRISMTVQELKENEQRWFHLGKVDERINHLTDSLQAEARQRAQQEAALQAKPKKWWRRLWP